MTSSSRSNEGDRPNGSDALVRRLRVSMDVRAVPGSFGSIVTQFVTHPRPVFVWYPVDLATPDRAAARGRPSTQPPAELVQLRPRDVVW